MSEMRRKLIEVALPLEAINRESAHEKSIRQAHPSTLHLWWARRPLAACRAVLFASLVDDPSSQSGKFPTEAAQEAERQRLFRIIEELVKWENSNDERVLTAARKEILASTDGNPPPVYDPFCGGGSIPLEAQRLGLEAHASDLNPLAVLITKALVEIPSMFAGKPPVNLDAKWGQLVTDSLKGAAGLAEDVRHYGGWIRAEAERRIGNLYPKVKLPKEHGGGEATVIAWLWARIVKCPNPACGAQMPLVRSFALSTKKGKETHVVPVVSGKTCRFEVKTGGKAPGGTVNRRGASCTCCNSPVPFDHIRAEGKAKRMSVRLMAIVAEGRRGRVYLPPSEEHERIASSAKPAWAPDTSLPEQALGFRVQAYGMTRHGDLFTPRQLVALTTFSGLVGEVQERVIADARAAGVPDDQTPLRAGGTGACAYTEAVATYLGLMIDNLADLNNALCRWKVDRECPVQLFARQAIPMVWDFPEANPLSESSGSLYSQLGNMTRRLKQLCVALAAPPTVVQQRDATCLDSPRSGRGVVCTDPPYYDNIAYADLSDFFYVWLRRSIGKIWPDTTSTVLVPKDRELIASPHRFHGDREKARDFFEKGLAQAFDRMRETQHPDYPLILFYAFKQAEEDHSESDGEEGGFLSAVVSTGWETMLDGLLASGFEIHGTWPIRTEMAARSVGQGTNALASSIVLVCRARAADAPVAIRGEFLRALKRNYPSR